MAADVLRGLRELSTNRAQQETTINSIHQMHDEIRADYSGHSYSRHHEALRAQYRQIYTWTTDELKGLREIQDKVKRMIAKKQKTATTTIAAAAAPDSSVMSHSNSSSSLSSISFPPPPSVVVAPPAPSSVYPSYTEPAADPYTTPAASAYVSAGGAGAATSLSKYKKIKIKGEKGDIWSHEGVVLPVGLPVAALANENMWMQATILSYKGGARPKYEVLDADPGDPAQGIQQKRYWLDAKKIIPLHPYAQYPFPKRREFPRGHRVLSVFPVEKVTVLYPATILQGPKKVKNRTPVYVLQFEDDDVPERTVDVDQVCPLPEDIDLAVS